MVRLVHLLKYLLLLSEVIIVLVLFTQFCLPMVMYKIVTCIHSSSINIQIKATFFVNNQKGSTVSWYFFVIYQSNKIH